MSDAVNAYAALLAEIPPVARDAEADAGKRGTYRYCSLSQCMVVVGPLLQKHKLGVRYEARAEEPVEFDEPCDCAPNCGHAPRHIYVDRLAVTAHLVGYGAMSIASATFVVPVSAVSSAGIDAQAFGSARTYAMRYALSLLLGLAFADADDDGAAAKAAARPTSAAPTRKPGLVTVRARVIAVDRTQVERKDGSGTYTKYVVRMADGTECDTLKDALADAALRAVGRDADITYEDTGKWRSLRDVTNIASDAPPAPTAPPTVQDGTAMATEAQKRTAWHYCQQRGKTKDDIAAWLAARGSPPVTSQVCSEMIAWAQHGS